MIDLMAIAPGNSQCKLFSRKVPSTPHRRQAGNLPRMVFTIAAAPRMFSAGLAAPFFAHARARIHHMKNGGNSHGDQQQV
jgi:hypothetical protein